MSTAVLASRAPSHRIHDTISSILLLTLALTTGCVTERSRYTPEGHEVPGRGLMDVRQYTYRCEPVVTKGIKDIEQVLNEFGRNGWELAGFMHRDGDIFAFCVQK